MTLYLFQPLDQDLGTHLYTDTGFSHKKRESGYICKIFKVLSFSVSVTD